VCVCVCVSLGMEPSALHILGRPSTIELHSSPKFFCHRSASPCLHSGFLVAPPSLPSLHCTPATVSQWHTSSHLNICLQSFCSELTAAAGPVDPALASHGPALFVLTSRRVEALFLLSTAQKSQRLSDLRVLGQVRVSVSECHLS
jgi:hypothetical protein